MRDLILGVDPGVSGALVLVDQGTGDYTDHLIMPVMKVGSTNRCNGSAILAWVRDYIPRINHAYLEKVHAMPKQGVSSSFSFGHSTGYIEGVITAAAIPLTLVPPTQWKRGAGLIGSDKDAARSRAIQLYPSLRVLDLKGKGQAVADALLIARHGIGLKSEAA